MQSHSRTARLFVTIPTTNALETAKYFHGENTDSGPVRGSVCQQSKQETAVYTPGPVIFALPYTRDHSSALYLCA